MTDYNAMSHQQLYSYVWSGSPSAVDGEATLNQSQGKAITDAANNLFTTLTKIQSSWSGAAADEFTQQTNAILNQMKDHAEAAQKIYTAMSHASSVLQWAQTYMPSPPSEAEDAIADIDDNSVVGTIFGIGTLGASALASEAAKKDIEAKKATAVHVMTTLASAYTQAASELARTAIDVTTPDPVSGGKSSTKSKDSSSSSSAATNAATAGMMLPYTAGVVAAHTSGEGSGGSSVGSGEYSYTTPKSSTGTGSTAAPSTGATGTGSGSTGAGTVTSGLGATSTTGPGSAPVVGSTSSTSSAGYGSTGTPSDVVSYGTAGGLGSYGSSRLISDDDSSGYGAGGSGSYGSYGSAGGAGSGTQASGGTGTGEIGDEDAGGTGTGLIGSSTNTGTSTAAAAGDSSGSGSSVEGMGGMMGGMGMGMGRGAGGDGEERGNRASWLKEDEDFWYSEKMKNAAPPGGLIE
jgi:uncharacterized protein YukE